MKSKLNAPYFRYYLSELIILLLGTYLFSSKITILPWYSKPRTYDLLYLLLLLIFQFITFLIYWRGYEKYITFNKLRCIAGLEVCILCVMFMMCIYSIKLYILCSIISSIINIILIVYTIYISKIKRCH